MRNTCVSLVILTALIFGAGGCDATQEHEDNIRHSQNYVLSQHKECRRICPPEADVFIGLSHTTCGCIFREEKKP